MQLHRYHVAISLEPKRDWESWIVAVDSQSAVIIAANMIELHKGETIHEVHVSPPRHYDPR